VATTKTIGSGEIHAAIERLATAILQRHPGEKNLLLLGIANGGVELANRLATRLAQGLAPVPPEGAKPSAPHPAPITRDLSVTVGVLDISFHRDDFGRHPIPKEFAPTHIPADVHGALVILVDDVLFSGRTVKAALDELFDHGRPTKVELAVLVDRGGRLLPVAADYTGLTVTASADERVRVTLDPANPKQDAVSLLPKSPSKTAPAGHQPGAGRNRKSKI
jgi:pyrimidine operon attenuation protein/uracil phosphoribosyltransferase